MPPFAIEQIDVAQLDVCIDSPFADDDKRFEEEVRHVLKKNQTRRIPISIYSEVIGEYHHFYALIKAGHRKIEVIRLENPAMRWEIAAAIEHSAKIPMRNR
ncbi:MAG: hypothetical protein CFE29_26530 [Bradyrhizobiaceae bacterium PARB1]|nr:MAG: hypothetical protein CFE29_26530 [Bradyrhizobiaceae bacterium PARB1]